MPETEGRKSLRVRTKGWEAEKGAFKESCKGNEERWCREGDTMMPPGLRLWEMNADMVVVGK